MMTEQKNRVYLTRIWQVLSHVRGVMPDMQLQQVAIAFIFLRRIDCLIGKYAQESASFFSKNGERLSDERLTEKLCEISGGCPFYNYSGYTFKGILTANNSIEVVMNSYFQGFSKNVQDILDGMNFNQNLAIMQRQSRYLVELFEFFSELDFSISAFNNKQFIELITTIVSGESRKYGLYPTPIGLSKLICEILFCKEVCEGLYYDVDESSVYDPVCGTGSLLSYAGESAKALTGDEEVYLIGKDVSSFSCAIANALVLFTGDKNSFVEDVNTLTDDDSSNLEYHFVVADLPLGLPWTPIRDRIVIESQNDNGRFSKGLPGTGDSQFLFIQEIVSKMDGISGRAAFISSGSVLQGGSVKSGEARIRMWLIESGLVETIIALPAGILPYTNIPVYLWILACCDSNINRDNEYWEKMEGKVRLIDATQFAASTNHISIDESFIDSVVKEYKLLENTSVTKIVRKEELGFYEVGLLENGKKKETVTISLDTNIEQFIEKERQPFAKGKITVDYSSVEKGYSVDFGKFFNSTESDVTPLEESISSVLSVVEAIESAKPFIQQINNLNKVHSEDDSWKELPLRSATEVVFGINRPPVLVKEGLPILSVPYLRNPSGDEKYEVTPKTRCATENDVIVIVKGANTGEVFRGVNGILSPSLAAIKCTDENIITPRYMYYLLKGYEKSLMLMAKGATIKSIDAKMIPDFKCLVPPIEEQVQISEYLDTIIGKIDIVIEALNGGGGTFSKLRQALIENIVRGIWRIPK